MQSIDAHDDVDANLVTEHENIETNLAPAETVETNLPPIHPLFNMCKEYGINCIIVITQFSSLNQ